MSESTSSRTVRVLLFARYAELLGREGLELPASLATSVWAVVRHLRALPNGELLPEQPLVAVNRVQARGDVPLAPGDEVALLPPLAGG